MSSSFLTLPEVLQPVVALVQCGSHNAHKWQQKCAFQGLNASALFEVLVIGNVHSGTSLLAAQAAL
jgi:hypothetical protein